MSSAEKVDHERDVSLWEEHSPTGFTIFFAILSLFAVLGGFPYMVHKEPAVAGQFGDSFGFINAFFSAFAVAGLLVTIVIQIKEYRLAQIERRDALETQKEIGLQHAKNLEIQKQIAEGYTRNLEIQKQMSDQGYLSSVASSIATWSQMHTNFELPTLYNLNESHIDFMRVRRMNLDMLDRINRVNREYASTGQLDLASLREDDDLRDLDATTKAASVIASVVITILSGRLVRLLKQLPDDLDIEIKNNCVECLKYIDHVTQENASRSSDFAAETIWMLRACSHDYIQPLHDGISGIIDECNDNGEVREKVRVAVQAVQDGIIGPAVAMIDPNYDRI